MSNFVESTCNADVLGVASVKPNPRAARWVTARGWKKWAVAGGGLALLCALALLVKVNPQPAKFQDKVREYAPAQRSSAPVVAKLEAGLTAPASASLPTGPMIARTASLVAVANDFATARASMEQILLRHHGYAARLETSTPQGAARQLSASLRIPAAELDSAMRDLRASGQVESESQAGEEVTQQHDDLVVRLQNARETEQRLRAILQQRTGKISDVLEVEEQISRVRGEIEAMEVAQTQLEHRVSFASVDVQLTEEYRVQLNSPAASSGVRLRNAMVSGYRSALATALGMLLFVAQYGPSLLVWLVLLALPGALLWRKFRKA